MRCDFYIFSMIFVMRFCKILTITSFLFQQYVVSQPKHKNTYLKHNILVQQVYETLVVSIFTRNVVIYKQLNGHPSKYYTTNRLMKNIIQWNLYSREMFLLQHVSQQEYESSNYHTYLSVLSTEIYLDMFLQFFPIENHITERSFISWYWRYQSQKIPDTLLPQKGFCISS